MTHIEWTDRTWNPVVGCNKVSQGCKNCYAEIMHKRLTGMGQAKYSEPFSVVRCFESALMEPSTWPKKPSLVFVNSMADLFHENVPFEFINAVFTVIADAPLHVFQILTKRPERMVEFYAWKKSRFGIPWRPSSNVWLGVSVEDQENANLRIPLLLLCDAEVRFLSCEPLLGPVDLQEIQLPKEYDLGGSPFHINCLTGMDDEHFYSRHAKIDWVIVGGESGHKARPMHIAWVRRIQEDCEANGIPFFFKQWGNWAPMEFGKVAPYRNFGHWDSGGFFVEGEISRNDKFIMGKFDKKKSGRFLDGKTYDEKPQQGMEVVF